MVKKIVPGYIISYVILGSLFMYIAHIGNLIYLLFMTLFLYICYLIARVFIKITPSGRKGRTK